MSSFAFARSPMRSRVRAHAAPSTSAPSNAHSHDMKSLSRLSVVAWDVDGTLANTAALGYDSTNAILRERGLREITPEEYARGTRFTTPRRMAWHATGDADDVVGVALGAAFDARYVALVDASRAAFYDGVRDILRGLHRRGVKQGVLSNACGAYARAVIAANEAEAFVACAYGADDVPRAKPAPDGLRRVFETIGSVDVRNAAYIGDAPSDGEAARAAGCVAVGVSWGSHDLTRDDAARHFDVVFDSVADLRRAFFDDTDDDGIVVADDARGGD